VAPKKHAAAVNALWTLFRIAIGKIAMHVAVFVGNRKRVLVTVIFMLLEKCRGVCRTVNSSHRVRISHMAWGLNRRTLHIRT
jgi:hypothetical protein